MIVFTSTRSAATKTPLGASVDRIAAIALLHNHTTFQNLQPLVVENKVVASPPAMEWLVTESNSVSPSGVQPEYRAITVRIPFGPFGSKNVTTISAFIDIEDGLINVFQAPLGLYGRNQWRIVPSEDGGGLALLEEATLTGLAPLMPFIMMTKKTSHAELGAVVVKKLQEMH